jgi:hypothetical protein
MDTAMLYRGRMALLSDEANVLSSKVVRDARSYGGVLVVNWHDRSLAPERQWGHCYDYLLDQLEASTPWFATMNDAAEWFRWRRSVRFVSEGDGAQLHVVAPPQPAGARPARLVTRRRGAVEEQPFNGGSASVTLEPALTQR